MHYVIYKWLSSITLAQFQVGLLSLCHVFQLALCPSTCPPPSLASESFEMRGIIRADSGQTTSSLDEEVFDYTEGASAAEVEDALSQSSRPPLRRRDSQVGNSYGYESEGQNEGAVFDGPGYVAIPSSVSRMSHRDMSVERTKMLRRLSTDLGPGRPRGRHRRRSEDVTEGGQPEPDRRDGGDGAVSGDEDAVDDLASVDGSEAGNGDDGVGAGTSGDAESATRRRHHPRRSKDLDSPVMSRSVLDNIAQFFGGRTAGQGEASSSRRPSVSRSRRSIGSKSSRSRSRRRRSSDADDLSEYAVSEDGDNRWGYSSGEDDSEEEVESIHDRADTDLELSDMDFVSTPPSPRSMLPNMAQDQFFGDTRIDIFEEEELLEPQKPGLASRQSIFLQDEDMTIRFIGFTVRRIRQLLWRIGCFLSFGILGLLGHWFPQLWLRWVAEEQAFNHLDDTGFVVAEVLLCVFLTVCFCANCVRKTPHRDIALFPVKALEYPYPLSTVFGPSSGDPLQNGKAQDSLVTLSVVDYRYQRFALDPRTGLFSTVKYVRLFFHTGVLLKSCHRDWADPSWTSVTGAQTGLTLDTRQQRSILFGSNIIDIEGKSVVSLLVDEVCTFKFKGFVVVLRRAAQIIHPFYVFQIASIVLWSLDDYYYYAFCIALISVFSIVSTLLETRAVRDCRNLPRLWGPADNFAYRL